MRSDRVKGKIAIVMGAGSAALGVGNGKASAILYAREGAKVLAVDYNLAAAEETKRLIDEEGGDCVVFKADVSKSSDCKSVVEKCIETFGRIDILHNNVGIVEPSSLAETREETWDKVLDVNLKGMFLMCKYTIPYMEKQGGGSIINISSISSIRWLGYTCLPYAASKGGINTLTQQLALEYAPKQIRVNSILPGYIYTPLVVKSLRDTYGGDVDEMIKKRDSICPMGKMGTPWDVAYAALFLASDEAKYVTGVTLVVDGGMTLKMI